MIIHIWKKIRVRNRHPPMKADDPTRLDRTIEGLISPEDPIAPDHPQTRIPVDLPNNVHPQTQIPVDLPNNDHPLTDLNNPITQ